jgi:hypothetical protein
MLISLCSGWRWRNSSLTILDVYSETRLAGKILLSHLPRCPRIEERYPESVLFL